MKKRDLTRIEQSNLFLPSFASLIALSVLVLATVEGRAAEPERISLSALNSMERIGQAQRPIGSSRVNIEGAKNEWESFQVVVAAHDENMTVTNVEVTDLVGQGGATISREKFKLYREEYVRVRRSTPRAELPPGLYADPLVPFKNPITGQPIEPRRREQARWGEPAKVTGHDMFAVPFEVFRRQNQPIWGDVHIPKNAVSGVYEGKFRVSGQQGLSAEIPIRLIVWDFTLPDGPTHRNHFGSFRNITRFFDADRDSQRFREIEARYCQAMAEHRINPPIPDHLLPEINDDGSLTITPDRHLALSKFMTALHVTDFEIPRSRFARLPSSTRGGDYRDVSQANREKAQRYYRQFYDYLKENGWEQRAYVYLLDEPNLRENYQQVLVLGELVKEAVPQLQRLVVEQTYPQDLTWPNIDPAVDIWCPLWSFLDRETVQEKIKHGDEVWSYTALAQRSPRYHPDYQRVKDRDPPYWHIDRPLIVYRIPTWINRQYGVTGLLYWSTVTMVLEPWSNPAFAHPKHFNGGGYLFYPGTPCGIDGPVPSMRLKNLRDGMEDYEYFAILAESAGEDALKSSVDRIAPSWWEYCKDPRALLTARRELAETIVQSRKRK